MTTGASWVVDGLPPASTNAFSGHPIRRQECRGVPLVLGQFTRCRSRSRESWTTGVPPHFVDAVAAEGKRRDGPLDVGSLWVTRMPQMTRRMVTAPTRHSQATLTQVMCRRRRAMGPRLVSALRLGPG